MTAIAEEDCAVTQDLLRTALIDYASATPDNLAAISVLEVRTSGLTLSSGISPADLAHAVEDLALPDDIRTAFPELSEAEWAAWQRLTTLLYTLLSR